MICSFAGDLTRIPLGILTAVAAFVFVDFLFGTEEFTRASDLYERMMAFAREHPFFASNVSPENRPDPARFAWARALRATADPGRSPTAPASAALDLAVFKSNNREMGRENKAVMIHQMYLLFCKIHFPVIFGIDGRRRAAGRKTPPPQPKISRRATNYETSSI